MRVLRLRRSQESKRRRARQYCEFGASPAYNLGANTMRVFSHVVLISSFVAVANNAAAQSHSDPTIVNARITGAPHSCPPDKWFPRSAINANENGTASLCFHIGIDGRVKDLLVLETSGFTELDQAAMSCASTWLYTPATKDGQPIEVPWGAKVSFHLSVKGTPPPSQRHSGYFDSCQKALSSKSETLSK